LNAQLGLGVFDPKSGAVTPLALPSGAYAQPRVSPDGTRVAFSSDDGKEAVVWVYELSGATAMRRLTIGGRNRFPVWSADGQRVAFQSDREGDQGIFWQRADGAGLAERLTKPETGESHLPEAWSPDGKFLLFTVTPSRHDEFKRLWMLSMAERKVSPAGDAKTGVFSLDASFSPDGRFIAYYQMIGAVRGPRVYVEPFPPNGTKYELANALAGAGIHPVWSSDGKQLYTSPTAGRFGAIPIVTQPSFGFGHVVTSPLMFADLGLDYPRGYDVARTGAIVGLMAAKEATPMDKRIDVVLHWFDELKQRVPTK
jgi:dipeptidyl aminopeptidase/acylaminoacyl peptidase